MRRRTCLRRTPLKRPPRLRTTPRMRRGASRERPAPDRPSRVRAGPGTEVLPGSGAYRIIHRLGQGGFGTVYLAHDDDLDRPVAVKVPNADRITRAEDVEAFLVEARILAKLDHPHIVPVFDVGRTEDGLCFVVSKLIEGSDLAARMGQARHGLPGFGGTGGRRRRRLALRPHPRAGPPGHQARQHPDRRLRQTLRGGLRARPQG